MSNVEKVNLLSERTSGVLPVIFSMLKLRTRCRFRHNLGCQYLLNVCSAQAFSHLLAHKEMMGVDNLGHFSDDSSCGEDNGFVLSWSPIKVDLGELVWEEDNFEKLGREDWFL